ncbi:MAG: hypothetical protein ACI9UU_003487, partial [Candidatus Azotimanducaceae bacterium]
LVSVASKLIQSSRETLNSLMGWGRHLFYPNSYGSPNFLPGEV